MQKFEPSRQKTPYELGQTYFLYQVPPEWVRLANARDYNAFLDGYEAERLDLRDAAYVSRRA